MVGHLLVTNDFPPKVGGIQTYLWELWRRMPPDRVTVLTTPHRGAEQFDAQAPMAIHRSRQPVLLPTPGLTGQVRRVAEEVGASLVVLDPALPLGDIGPDLGVPYAVVVHGAEVSVPACLPGVRSRLRRVLAGAVYVVAASQWVLDQVEDLVGRSVPATVISGVDVERFKPLDADERARVRQRFGLAPGTVAVVGMSRLVPRKGFDVLVAAARLAVGSGDAPLDAGLEVLVAGGGRDARRLQRLIDHSRAPVRLLGRVDDADLPLLLGCADIFAVPCRRRWAGLEQEGFGLVFLEAAACGVPQVAGDSGGAAEAVVHGETGLVVGDPRDPESVARALRQLAGDSGLRTRLGIEARRRVEEQFSYPMLAGQLSKVLAELEGEGR